MCGLQIWRLFSAPSAFTVALPGGGAQPEGHTAGSSPSPGRLLGCRPDLRCYCAERHPFFDHLMPYTVQVPSCCPHWHKPLADLYICRLRKLQSSCWLLLNENPQPRRCCCRRPHECWQTSRMSLVE